MPAGIELAVSRDTNALRSVTELLQIFQRGNHFVFRPNNTNIVLHGLLEIMLYRVGIFTTTALERLERTARHVFDLSAVDLAKRIFPCEVCREFPRTFSKHQQIRER